MNQFDQYERDDQDQDNLYDDERGGNDDEDFGVRDEDFEDTQKYQSTFSDMERVSVADECGGDPISVPNGNLQDLYKEINKIAVTPEDRFKRQVGAISHWLTEGGFFDVNIEMRNKMCVIASSLSNIKYLNPTAYILGFVATNGGADIDKSIVDEIFGMLNQLQDDSVKEADVIRYARYAVSLGKQFNV
jgi:hypothetical protein